MSRRDEDDEFIWNITQFLFWASIHAPDFIRKLLYKFILEVPKIDDDDDDFDDVDGDSDVFS